MTLVANKVERITETSQAKEILCSYLSELPHFLEKISSIEEYVDKVLRFGNMYVIKCDEKIKGFIIFYSNDEKNRKAYVSLIVVSKEFRRQNVGTDLIKICETISKNLGMNMIRLEVDRDNESAQRFYQVLGFSFVDDGETESLYMEKNI